jgi:hypothetical protein
MSRHRLTNLALAFALIVLLSYFGPSLDDSKCLIGACGLLHLDEDIAPFSGWELLLFWALLIFMIVSTVAVICAGLGLFAFWMGWVK